MLGSLKAALSFLTIIPMKWSGDMDDIARSMWTFPLVGAIIGLVAGIAGIVMQGFLPMSLAAVAALFALYILTGFHHLDGLLDIGDALMIRGDAEKRRAVMKDNSVGAGGFGLGFFVMLLTFHALFWNPNILVALVVAEATAKFSMVLLAFLARPSHEGMGNAFLTAAKGNARLLFAAFVVFMAVVIPFAPMKLTNLTAISMVLALGSTHVANRSFGGVSGDVFGAVNELARLVALVVLL